MPPRTQRAPHAAPFRIRQSQQRAASKTARHGSGCCHRLQAGLTLVSGRRFGVGRKPLPAAARRSHLLSECPATPGLTRLPSMKGNGSDRPVGSASALTKAARPGASHTTPRVSARLGSPCGCLFSTSSANRSTGPSAPAGVETSHCGITELARLGGVRPGGWRDPTGAFTTRQPVTHGAQGDPATRLCLPFMQQVTGWHFTHGSGLARHPRGNSPRPDSSPSSLGRAAAIFSFEVI